jgi:MtrB/PioB family decaheme-associated outer membrane protein
MTCDAPHRRSRLALGAAAVLGAALAYADSPPPNTSDWKCQQCPFFQGYAASAEAGMLYADGANDSYGRYSGIDHRGGYADAGASGQWRSSSGNYADFDLENLGLASRDGYIEAGREGRYDLRLGYDGQPTRDYDTGATPFQSRPGGQLTLPANWVSANSTAGMTQLSQSLEPANIEYDRRTVSLLGRFFAGANWTLFGDFSHQQKVGTGLTGGSFLTEAVQLAEPIDYVTDTLEAGAAWTGRRASLRVAYTGSWFKDDIQSLTWDNPFLPLVAGATQGRLALAPSNNLQQLSASGELQLPIWSATTLTYSASLGRQMQDSAFLPVSTLPGTPGLVPSSLDGDVHLSHYGLGLATRPIAKLHVRGTASYDGRDDHTAPVSVAYVVTDSLPGGTFITPRYGEDRTRLEGSADYRVFRWVRMGVGGEYVNVHYAPGQVVTYTDETRSWVSATFNALSSLSLALKGGNGRRAASSFNIAALPPAESPLLRAYNYAPRDRNFFSLTGSWTITATLTWSLEGAWADDAYRLSSLGLQNARDRRTSSTLTWAPTEKLSLYADAGYQRLSATQYGLAAAGAADWQVADAQYYSNAGAGGHWAISGRWDVGADYAHSTSRGNDSVLSGGATAPFPENHTRLDSLSLNATYRWTRALRVRLRYGYEKLDSSDWALDFVGPSTVPNLLAYGIQPYQHQVNWFGLTFLYDFGASASASASLSASPSASDAPQAE